MRFSLRRRMRRGGQSGEGNSALWTAGIQYWRMRLPIGVPGPQRVIISLSAALSIFTLLE
jgi:hypothetical protein